MSRIVKYLNLLVLSTFMIGQVQYAYSTYFCTMMQQQVSAPVMKMNMGTEAKNTCDQCKAVTPDHQGEQLNQSDCIQSTTLQKSTLDNFTDSQKLVHHFVPAAFISNSLSTVGSQLLLTTYHVLPTPVSPPSDLPILNSNLRF